MNVMYIADVGETGGATKSMMEMIYKLTKNYNVTPIVITSKKGKVSEFCDKNNFTTIASGHSAFYISSGQTILKKIIKFILIPFYFIDYKIRNVIAINRIVKSVEMDKIDIIHTNVNRNDVGAILAKKYKIPHVWHIREFGDLDYECFSLKSKYISFMNNNTTKFIAISKTIKQHWAKKGLLESKINVIYNGVNTKNSIEEVQKVHKNKNDVKMIIAGNISKNKGQIQVIEAINKLDKDVKSNIFLDIYGGGDNSYIAMLKRLVNKYNLSENVKFKGSVNNLNNLLYNYDIGLMCSKSEAFGRVTVEYMANGLITIASNTGANQEIITNLNDGFIYQYNDYRNLAKIINKVYNLSEKEKENIIKNAYDKVKNNFTSELNAYNIFNLYKKILNKNNTDK